MALGRRRSANRRHLCPCQTHSQSRPIPAGLAGGCRANTSEHAHTCAHAHRHTRTHTYTHTHAHTYTHGRAHRHAHAHRHTHAHIRTHTHTHMGARTDTHMHTDTHAHVRAGVHRDCEMWAETRVYLLGVHMQPCGQVCKTHCWAPGRLSKSANGDSDHLKRPTYAVPGAEPI